jgi:hypothetical protein
MKASSGTGPVQSSVPQSSSVHKPGSVVLVLVLDRCSAAPVAHRLSSSVPAPVPEKDLALSPKRGGGKLFFLVSVSFTPYGGRGGIM